MRAITYRRVSTREQGESGNGLAGQTTALAATIAAKGWQHVADFYDVHTGKTTNGRINLQAALATLQRGEAEVLVCTKVDRLARSTIDFGRILKRANEEGWKLVVTDLGVDTSTSTGKMIANVVAVLAEWEADQISERTRAGLAEVRRKGTRLGRTAGISPELRDRIVGMKRDGLSLAKIAAALNDEKVPTVRGGARWYPSTIGKVLGAASAPAPGGKGSTPRRRVPVTPEATSRVARSSP